MRTPHLNKMLAMLGADNGARFRKPFGLKPIHEAELESWARALKPWEREAMVMGESTEQLKIVAKYNCWALHGFIHYVFEATECHAD